MTVIIYSLVSLVIAGFLCLLAGRSRPWIAQFSFAALVIGSLATASKISPLIEGVYVSVAIGLYSMTFLLANYLREIFGKPFAIQAIWMGLIGEILFVFATQFALLAPSAPFWPNQSAFDAVFSITPRIFIASVLAYVCAEFTDVHVYHALSRLTKGHHLWLRNNVGTIVGQSIDSAIFYTVAFYGVVPNLFALIITTCIVKYIIAAADTPVLYFVVHWAREGKEAGAANDSKRLQAKAEP
jgi:queuosine precursor transporter